MELTVNDKYVYKLAINKTNNMDTVINFNQIVWGPDEAKGDTQLQNYFYKISDYDKIIEGKKRYVIGRKGTGKTAVLEKIRLDCIRTHSFFVRQLTLREFPIIDLKSFADKSMKHKSKYVSIWEFLILVELCKLICQDEGNKNLDSYVNIRNFLKNNFPEETGGFRDTVKLLKGKNSKISVFDSFFQFGEVNENEVSIEMHYSKVVDRLKELIASVNSKSYYFLLFDELDEGYSLGDQTNNLLILALLRAVENISLHFRRDAVVQIRPVVALRSDIFDNLKDNDLNKLDDYLVRLNWRITNNRNYSLKELINIRIRTSLSVADNVDPWNFVIYDYNPKIPQKNKSLYSYMVNRTFERPRDMIKFMKYCSEEHQSGKLNSDTVMLAEKKYSNWFYRELRDEIQSHLKIWKECLVCIQNIGKSKLDYIELQEALENDTECSNYIVNNNIDIDDLVSKLYDFGIIGNINNNNIWVFKYKDEDTNLNKKQKLLIHYGLRSKLNLM